MDWAAEIETAAARIDGYVRRTPIMSLRGFVPDRAVQIKLEHLQHTGSFKARGAFNTLLSLPVPAAGLVAASGGNHGAAVAFAAAQLGHHARIYVPAIAGPAKIALIRQAGAELVVTQGDYAVALNAANDYAAKTGATQIHAYDAPATVIGQGTVMWEWQDQGLDADTVLIAVGGGGLISGAMGWLGNRCKIVAVEPELAPTLYTALRDGPDSTVAVAGVAANALGARKIGRICYDLATDRNLHSVLVSDAAITATQRALWQQARLLVEPAGATALAALYSGAYQPEPGEKVAALLCGGNIAPDPFDRQADCTQRHDSL